MPRPNITTGGVTREMTQQEYDAYLAAQAANAADPATIRQAALDALRAPWMYGGVYLGVSRADIAFYDTLADAGFPTVVVGGNGDLDLPDVAAYNTFRTAVKAEADIRAAAYRTAIGL